MPSPVATISVRPALRRSFCGGVTGVNRTLRTAQEKANRISFKFPGINRAILGLSRPSPGFWASETHGRNERTPLSPRYLVLTEVVPLAYTLPIMYRKALKKLASLSALGAGALAAGAENADASTIFYSGFMDQKVGFDTGSGYGAGYTAPALPGGAQFKFGRSVSAFSTSGRAYDVFAADASANSNLRFAATRIGLVPFVRIFNTGAQWSSLGRVVVSDAIGGRAKTDSGSHTFGNKPFSRDFALFQFGGCPSSSGTCYGWVELNLANTLGTPGPNIEILGYGYDTSGATIPAGAGIPEPQTFELAGLGALVFGAIGLRRWRAARKA